MNIITKLWKSILSLDNQQFLDKIEILQKHLKDKDFKIKQWEVQHEADVASIKKYKDKLKPLQSQLLLDNNIISTLKHKVEELMIQNKSKYAELEKYWNNKIKPLKSITYTARDGKGMNIIDFFNKNNNKVSTVDGNNDDEKANNALKYVQRYVTYKSDIKTSGRSEQWQWANETVESKTGDCEDGAILMANMMVKSGIPYWRVRLNGGNVQSGGHCYVTYLREKDNKWYVMDWCYWPKQSINFGKTWKSAKKYFGIWWSWNKKFGFVKDTLDR